MTREQWDAMTPDEQWLWAQAMARAVNEPELASWLALTMTMQRRIRTSQTAMAGVVPMLVFDQAVTLAVGEASP